MSKVGRNDPCPCGSGKKFKKCCEEKTKHKKFHAEVLKKGLPFPIHSSEEAAKVSSDFFKRNITVTKKPSEPSDEEKNPVM